jgi:hypothetical protein
MFHCHATPWCIYIIADKLCLNKLSQSTTHLSRANLCPPNNMEHHVTSTSTRLNFFKYFLYVVHCAYYKLLRQTNKYAYLLVCLNNSSNVIGCLRFLQVWGSWSSKWAATTSIAKHRLMQVTEQLGSASSHPIQFFSCRGRPSTGDWLTDCSLCIAKEIWHPCVTREVASFCHEMQQKWRWRLTYTNWPRHLNAALWKQNKWKLWEIL